MRRRRLRHRQLVDQMRAQHLVLDLHLVRGQEEPGTGGEQRGADGLRVRVEQPSLGQCSQPGSLAHPPHLLTSTLSRTTRIV